MLTCESQFYANVASAISIQTYHQSLFKFTVKKSIYQTDIASIPFCFQMNAWMTQIIGKIFWIENQWSTYRTKYSILSGHRSSPYFDSQSDREEIKANINSIQLIKQIDSDRREPHAKPTSHFASFLKCFIIVSLMLLVIVDEPT